ncbi:MAG: flagellar basal body rod protein FlgC [Bacteroidetes bacterium]|nr:flagellar basal body rod protein FlgC [Bacteroidota bacterium]
MKVAGNFSGFDTSANGLSLQRKRMDLIAENIANADTSRADNGEPYKRKYLHILSNPTSFNNQLNTEGGKMRLNISNSNHVRANEGGVDISRNREAVNYEVLEDGKNGEKIFMPNHPDADENGYIETSNVNVITEMVEMIAASRTYEANLTAFNASKQMAKDALEI